MAWVAGLGPALRAGDHGERVEGVPAPRGLRGAVHDAEADIHLVPEPGSRRLHERERGRNRGCKKKHHSVNKTLLDTI